MNTRPQMYRYRFISNRKRPSKKQMYRIKAKVWLYSGIADWHFVTVPVTTSKQIKKRHGLAARGWGSLRVNVTLGKSQWKTSVFPDKKANAYVLPLKADIRAKEGVKAGKTISFSLHIL